MAIKFGNGYQPICFPAPQWLLMYGIHGTIEFIVCADSDKHDSPCHNTSRPLQLYCNLIILCSLALPIFQPSVSKRCIPSDLGEKDSNHPVSLEFLIKNAFLIHNHH